MSWCGWMSTPPHLSRLRKRARFYEYYGAATDRLSAGEYKTSIRTVPVEIHRHQSVDQIASGHHRDGAVVGTVVTGVRVVDHVGQAQPFEHQSFGERSVCAAPRTSGRQQRDAHYGRHFQTARRRDVETTTVAPGYCYYVQRPVKIGGPGYGH